LQPRAACVAAYLKIARRRAGITYERPAWVYGGPFCVLPSYFRRLTLAPIRHDCGHAAVANKSRSHGNGHHGDNADHPYKLYEIARISTISHFDLLTNTFHIAQITRFCVGWFDGK